MKLIPLTALAFLSGCSTVANLEPLNDTPLRGVRETAAVLHKTDQVLNGRRGSSFNTQAVNRKYGEFKGLEGRPYDFHDVPYVIKSIEYIFE